MSWEDFRNDSVDFARDNGPNVWRLVKAVFRPWRYRELGHAWVNVFREACGWPRGHDRAGYYFGHWLALAIIPGLVLWGLLT